MQGQLQAGAVKRLFGCDDGRPHPGAQSLPFQSMRCAGGSLAIPSHQTSPSSVNATFVKIVLLAHDKRAFGLVSIAVPGATPKKPFSGLIARSSPSLLGLIQAMSSPTVVTSHPSPRRASGGMIIAKSVLPHALANAAVGRICGHADLRHLKRACAQRAILRLCPSLKQYEARSISYPKAHCRHNPNQTK